MEKEQKPDSIAEIDFAQLKSRLSELEGRMEGLTVKKKGSASILKKIQGVLGTLFSRSNLELFLSLSSLVVSLTILAYLFMS